MLCFVLTLHVTNFFQIEKKVLSTRKVDKRSEKISLKKVKDYLVLMTGSVKRESILYHLLKINCKYVLQSW